MYWETGFAKQELKTNSSAKSIMEEVGRPYFRGGIWKYWPHKHDVKKAIAQLELRLERDNKEGCCCMGNAAAVERCVSLSDSTRG